MQLDLKSLASYFGAFVTSTDQMACDIPQKPLISSGKAAILISSGRRWYIRYIPWGSVCIPGFVAASRLCLELQLQNVKVGRAGGAKMESVNVVSPRPYIRNY